jgi:hypothetical protein
MSLISDERAEELLANEKEKDAEIERLSARCAFMASNDYVYSLTSEIERLKRINVSLVAQERGFREEIERLKRMYAEMFCFREDLALENMELRAQIEGLKNCSDLNWIRLKALLARAADALEHVSWVSEEYCGLPSQCHDLIAELREAAE